jgi:hypothetical protein
LWLLPKLFLLEKKLNDGANEIIHDKKFFPHEKIFSGGVSLQQRNLDRSYADSNLFPKPQSLTTGKEKMTDLLLFEHQ